MHREGRKEFVFEGLCKRVEKKTKEKKEKKGGKGRKLTCTEVSKVIALISSQSKLSTRIVCVSKG